MATDKGIIINGYVESTIYSRDGREWISLDGKEMGVHEFRSGTSPIALKLVQRGDSYSTVHGVSAAGVYGGTEILERISHDISVFWANLSSIIDSVKNTPGYDDKKIRELSEGVISALHACGSEIANERAKTSAVQLEVKSLKYDQSKLHQELDSCRFMLDIEQKRSISYSKALKCVLHPPTQDLPLLHRLCLDNSISVTEIVHEYGLDIHQQVDYQFFEPICYFPIETKLRPIHVAALSGNSSTMKELYEMDHRVAESLTGDEKMSVLDLSAFGSQACFDLCKSWSPVSAPLPNAGKLAKEKKSWLLSMAALGGNLNLLSSLISPTYSIQQCMAVWKDMVTFAFVGGHVEVLNWLMTFVNALDYPSHNPERFFRILFSVKGHHIQLSCLQWMMKLGFESQETEPSFDSSFLNRMVSSHRVDILDWLASLPGFELTAYVDGGCTLMHTACFANSIPVLEWVLHLPSSKQDYFHILDGCGRHLVHVAASNGSTDALKWICEKVHKFQHIPGSAHLLAVKDHFGKTILHYAAQNASTGTLEWLQTVHGANLAHASADSSGQLPIHCAWKNRNVVEWLVRVGHCELTTRDSQGHQLLHLAIQRNKLDVVDFIVSQLGPMCLDVPISESGLTAVHMVETEEMAHFLWKCGANLSTPSKDGQTLFDLNQNLRPWLASKGISGP